MDSPLVFPEVVNTLEDFLTNVASLRILAGVLNTDIAGYVGFPHLPRAVRTAGHHPAYDEKRTRIIYSGKLCAQRACAPSN